MCVELVEQFGATATQQEGPHVSDDVQIRQPSGIRVRRLLIALAPLVALIGAIRFGLWWGTESQRALLHGRRWPPEALSVFLGR